MKADQPICAFFNNWCLTWMPQSLKPFVKSCGSYSDLLSYHISSCQMFSPCSHTSLSLWCYSLEMLLAFLIFCGLSPMNLCLCKPQKNCWRSYSLFFLLSYCDRKLERGGRGQVHACGARLHAHKLGAGFCSPLFTRLLQEHCLVDYMHSDPFDTEARVHYLPSTPNYCCSSLTRGKYPSVLYLQIVSFIFIPWVPAG